MRFLGSAATRLLNAPTAARCHAGVRGKRLNKSSHLNAVQRRRAERQRETRGAICKRGEINPTVVSSPKASSCTWNKGGCGCQEAWIMIALHGGYKANIKAVHVAARHFKGCGERGAHHGPQ